MPTKIQSVRISSGAIAAGGGATAYSANPIHGRILAVFVNYPTNTCTVDIDTDGETPTQKILDLSAANTDVVVYPRTYAQTEAGVDLTYDATRKIPTEFVVGGRLKLTIASGTEGEIVVAKVLYEAF